LFVVIFEEEKRQHYTIFPKGEAFIQNHQTKNRIILRMQTQEKNCLRAGGTKVQSRYHLVPPLSFREGMMRVPRAS
jgi:hypothetical protein